ncbi:MAG: SpoIIE family protein phosphatase [Pseudomonadota bacterium]
MNPPKVDCRICRVLVVEDSRTQRIVLGQRLRLLGYEVVEAADGVEALERLETGGIDMVVSDWMMPRMDGIALCRAIRGFSDQAYVYFLLMTAQVDEGSLATGLEAGADDFIAKPASASELSARLTAGRRLTELHHRQRAQQREIERAYGEITELYARIETDLGAAAALQRTNLPPVVGEVNGCRIGTFCRYHGHVGGDHLGYFPVGRRMIGFFSIDVAGHGIASCLLAMRLAQLLDPGSNSASIAFAAGTRRARAPHEVLGDLNRMFMTGLDHDIYFTMAYGLLDVRKGTAGICTAGHWPAAVQRADGSVVFMESGTAPPVGLIEDAEFPVAHIDLAPGDRLMLYTDGLTEAPGDDEHGMMGMAGLGRLIEALADADTADLLPMLWDRLSAGLPDGGIGDDVSALVIERGKPGAVPASG